MLFRRATLDAIAAGQVDLAFRRWTKPTVKTGGRLRTAIGELAIRSVTPCEAADMEDADARRAGFATVAQLLASLAAPTPGARLYRIELAYAGQDSRLALRTNVEENVLAEILQKLQAIDRRAPAPCTLPTLELIATWPGRRAPELAGLLGRETAPFKASVRRLKEFGLTISLETGYRLSPRGEAILHLARQTIL